jgi:hypothetical protein
MSLVGRLVAAIVAFVSALGLAPSHAQQRTSPNNEILSKADAIRLFGLTKQQWFENVKAAVAAGAVSATDRQSLAPGMTTRTPEGDFLTVRVDYSKGDRKPTFIQVVVAYPPNRRPRMTAEMLTGVIEAAQRQMAPEFYIHGSVDPIEGGVAVFFHISDQR